MNEELIGTRVTDFWSLPVGTIIWCESRGLNAYRDPVIYLTDNQGMVGAGEMHQYGEWIVTSVPDVEFVDNLARVQQRAQTSVTGRARLHLGTSTDADRAMRSLNLPTFEPSLGMWVDAGDLDLSRRLRTGALIQVGSTDKWAWSAIHRWHRDSWLYVTGGWRGMPIGGVLIEAEGVGRDEWTVADPEESEAEAILVLKHRLWEVGQRARADYSWCGTADYVMGLTGAHSHLPALEEAA